MNVFPISCGLGYAFLIEADHGLFLIDSGSPGNHKIILLKMKALGRKDLKLIIITHAHYDHYGSALALKNQTKALIAAHPLDAGSMSKGHSPLGESRKHGFLFPPIQAILNRINPLPATPPDLYMQDGDSLNPFGLDAIVLHTPGHTLGHISIILGNGTAFTGDLLGRVPSVKPQNLLAMDWGQIPASIQKLKNSNPTKIYTGHAALPIQGDQLNQI
ncbi:MAG: hypothetical protein CVU40_18285 [Chloroflexi bacterium HGW-Chloroflexi-2]|jgi:glyoxylase-like metal-dependent hydrolase (beta-lactamase superfamily II)|nr:MAG: hypothetical protein CVU40_18285 [Chloroflexi bacterium HGW-Chloroflexi-2]